MDTFTPLPSILSNLCATHLSGRLSLGRSLGLESCVVQLLDLALLAVLPVVSLQFLVLMPLYPLSTHLPLGEPELALAPALSSDALVLLEGSADDARCDRDVAVVAVRKCQLRCSRTQLQRSEAYVRPAVFQAADIVMVGWGLTGRWVGLRVADGVGGVESKVAALGAAACQHVTRCG